MFKHLVQLLAGAAVIYCSFLLFQLATLVISMKSETVVLVEVGRFEDPIAIAASPGTRDFFVAERSGRVHRVATRRDGTFRQVGVVLDISARVTTKGEGGLLGLAVSVAGDELYVLYTDRDSYVRTMAYPISDGNPVADSERLVLAIAQPHMREGDGWWTHVGGHLLVDLDGNLLIGLGDGSISGPTADSYGNSRNLMTLMGSILRVTPTIDEEKAYTIPRDNPYADQESIGLRSEILAFGLRNPWRFDIDPVTGDLWVADVGHLRIEEINYLAAEDVASGADFGWVAMEGSEVFYGPDPDGDILPVHEYQRINEGFDSRCAVIGGVVVRGDNHPSLEGAFLFSDLCDGRIRAILPDDRGNWMTKDLGVSVESPVSFARSGSGDVYVISLAGAIYRLA